MESFDSIVRKSWGYNQKDYESSPQWGLLKELYVRNYMIPNSKDYSTLPKNIHQIWLGGSLPEEYKAWCSSWKKFNPDWEYILWTDEDAKKCTFINHSIFNSIKNPGQRSDYFRYLILNKYGGIYVDTDFECLKPFEDLTYANFIVGVGYPSFVELYIGLIACTPHHPVIKEMIRSINDINGNGWKNVFETTGTYAFTRAFFKVVKKYQKGVIALPTDYFYPFPNTKGHEKENGRDYITDCSYAVHHWEVSWSKEKIKEHVSK